jgi:hypothetical protein
VDPDPAFHVNPDPSDDDVGDLHLRLPSTTKLRVRKTTTSLEGSVVDTDPAFQVNLDPSDDDVGGLHLRLPSTKKSRVRKTTTSLEGSFVDPSSESGSVGRFRRSSSATTHHRKIKGKKNDNFTKRQCCGSGSSI